jgi:hypothetical protein
VLTPGLRWFLGIAAALALIAGVLLFGLATETDRFFSWTIEPPLTAAFLGAAYWAAFALLAAAARETAWPPARAAIPPVFAIAVLLLVATLIHLDKFDMDSIFGWFWLTVYIGVTPLLVFLVIRQARQPAPEPRRGGIPLTPPVRLALALQGAVMLLLGAALFIAPADADALWPWTLTPLTARAIGAFLVGFGVGAAYGMLEDDLSLLRGAALAYASLGALELAAIALHGSDVTADGPGVALYVAFCATVLATGVYGLVSERSAASRS